MNAQHRLKTTLAACVLSSCATVSFAQDISVSDIFIKGTLDTELAVSLSPLHAEGPTSIELIAVELAGETSFWNFSDFNDEGTGGDSVAGDGIWSQAIRLSGAEAGEYKVKAYILDVHGAELETDYQAFILN